MKVGFDLDGVLLDSESDLAWLDRALDEALAAVGRPSSPENRRALSPGRVHDFEAAAADLGVDPDVLWRARTRRYTARKVAAVRTGEIGPFDDVDAIERLDGPLFVVSNSPQEVVDAFLGTRDLDGSFAVAVGRGQARADLADLKPDAAFHDRVVDALGPGEYVYVGDSADDRAFAASAGMGYVHLDRGERGLPDAVADVRAGRWERP